MDKAAKCSTSHRAQLIIVLEEYEQMNIVGDTGEYFHIRQTRPLVFMYFVIQMMGKLKIA